MSKEKVIGIDARFYGSKNRGLGRYTTKLIKGLEKIDKRNKYFIYLTKENFDLYKPRNKNFKKKLLNIRWYSWKEQLILPFLIDWKKLDFIHFPHFNVPLLTFKPFIVTIHDLILLKYPTRKATTLNRFYYFFKMRAYKLILWRTIISSAQIISVSKFTKTEILKYFRIKSSKAEIIYEACLDSPKSWAELKKFRLKSSSSQKLLYVGAAYPHKNLKRLLLVFKNLKKRYKELELLIVGGDGYFFKEIKNFVKIKKMQGVVFLGHVENEKELRKIYKKADIFVFPSLYEGFGLPPLEAMREGLPVVSSNAGSIKEILKDGAYYFDPVDREDMERKIKRVLSSESLRRSLIKKGYLRVQKFSWQKMAKQTFKLYSKM
ncbi:MAG: glycosyltransferase [Candidatus Moranbacteria bacterium]|nr:glycosyltransferase [Candidatus Moranbacteria bacterium]